MNLPHSRQQAALQSAAQRLKSAFRDGVERALDVLGGGDPPAGLSREDAFAARFELNRKHSALTMSFNERLDESVATEVRRRQPGGTKSSLASITNWQSLSLMDDRQMEQQVAAERMGQTMRMKCDAELASLDSYVMTVLPASERPETDRNPLRTDVLSKAMLEAIEAVTEAPEVRRPLTSVIQAQFTPMLAPTYAAVIKDLAALGVEPAGMTVRSTQARDGFAASTRSQAFDGRPQGGGGTQDASASGSGGGAASAPPAFGGAGGSGTPMGHVDQEVMALIRRLAIIGNVTSDTQFETVMGARVSGPGGLSGGERRPLPNLIAAHREELRAATTSTLDHMVIDVVGSLFDQILSDPKVPPQMARHIARLQLPVLRAALGDPTFFSSRKHPVRRFVNRIASLAVAFDDFEAESAVAFLRLVRELVDEIVSGDFDQIEPYEERLDRLEAFIAEQARSDVKASGNVGAVVNQREIELLQQQRFSQQMQQALKPVQVDDFLRQFLTQVWSQAIVQSHRLHGQDHEITQRMRLAGRELVLSVQPKGSPVDRKNFLLRLPQLMKDLNEGIAIIGWPEAAKKEFMARLLPAHAESLKVTQSMRLLDFNLLAKQLDTVMMSPVPALDSVQPVPLQVPGSADDAILPDFTNEEARRIGLVQETAVDWDGSVDIDLSGDNAEVAAVDIEIDGLPAAAEPMEPVSGAALADHVQIGFSYRMHFEGGWQKVRLSHISPGRTFFVFTRGMRHQEAISMTARMLHRLCDSGRLRAFENAYLIERATARARKQLSELSSRMGTTTM
jgi:hypothetical protein